MNINGQQFRVRILLGVAVLLTIVSSGCLGVLHQIRLSDDGRYAVDVKLAMSKDMVTAMDSMGGEPTDTNEIFSPEDLAVDPESIPGLAEVVVEQLDNDVDIGIHFSGVMEQVPDGLGPEDAPFLPFEYGKRVVIGLPSLAEGKESASDPQSDQMASMFFASTKYQLVLDKYIYPQVFSAKVMAGKTEYPASLTELPGSWLIEFPFATWMSASEGCQVIIETGDSSI